MSTDQIKLWKNCISVEIVISVNEEFHSDTEITEQKWANVGAEDGILMCI